MTETPEYRELYEALQAHDAAPAGPARPHCLHSDEYKPCPGTLEAAGRGLEDPKVGEDGERRRNRVIRAAQAFVARYGRPYEPLPPDHWPDGSS